MEYIGRCIEGYMYQWLGKDFKIDNGIYWDLDISVHPYLAVTIVHL